MSDIQNISISVSKAVVKKINIKKFTEAQYNSYIFNFQLDKFPIAK